MTTWANSPRRCARELLLRRSPTGLMCGCLIDHQGIPLARTKSGTLRLAEDSRGLHVSADLEPRSSIVNNLGHAMARGDLDQMSFAFHCTRDSWDDDFTHAGRPPGRTA